jgi:hypothetical protein
MSRVRVLGGEGVAAACRDGSGLWTQRDTRQHAKRHKGEEARKDGQRGPGLGREAQGRWRGNNASTNEKTGSSVNKRGVKSHMRRIRWKNKGGVDHEQAESVGAMHGEIRRKGQGGVDGERVYERNERRKVTKNSHHQDPYMHPQWPRTHQGSGTQRTLRGAHLRVALCTRNGRGSTCP